MEALPTELLRAIIENADTQSRLSLCRVCHLFRSLCQPILFRQLKDVDGTTNLNQVISFGRTITDSSSLAAHIRLISIPYINSRGDIDIADALIPLLFHTIHLEHLSFSGSHHGDKGISLLSTSLLKNSLSLPKLRVLKYFSLSGKLYSPPGTWEPILSLPKVTTLFTNVFSERIDLLKKDIPLQNLQFIDTRLDDNTLTSLLQGCPSLKNFVYQTQDACNIEETLLQSQFNASTFSDILLSRRETLETLWIEFPRSYYTGFARGNNIEPDLHPASWGFEHVPKLTSLQRFVSLQQLVIDQALLSKYPQLPPQLRILVLTNAREFSMQLVEFLCDEKRSLRARQLEYVYLLDTGEATRVWASQIDLAAVPFELYVCEDVEEGQPGSGFYDGLLDYS
ncbi:hypothetical protein BJX70DRAFT_384077 [Aspergillus crustosus]